MKIEKPLKDTIPSAYVAHIYWAFLIFQICENAEWVGVPMA